MIGWDIFWKAAGVILPLIVGIYTFFATRQKQNNARFDVAEERIGKVEGRVGALEQTIGAMPGKEDTHKLEMMLTEMAGDMKAMRATMKGMSESQHRTEDIVGRHEDHLREKG